MDSWYVIKTKPKQENRASALLEKISLTVFLPMLQRDKNSETRIPLFPGYFFVRTDLTCPRMRRLIQFTRGIHSILGDKEGPISIADELIATLVAKTRDGSLIEQDLLLKEGNEVRVKTGILKDLIGIIDKNMSETGRVLILFQWISGKMRAALPYRLLEKVS